jgi:hypothetical protein
MKVLKNYETPQYSVTVTKIEQVEEIIETRELREDEDFFTFHEGDNTKTFDNSKETPYDEKFTKNVRGFKLEISRSYR